VSKRNYEHEKGTAQFQKLANTFPKNQYLLTNLATCALQSNQIEEAVGNYKQLRRADSNHTLVKGSELMAQILHRAEDASELSRLASDVLEISPGRPEGWLIAALCCGAKGDEERALTLVDKVG
jgi:predicted Zn-dependent protease